VKFYGAASLGLSGYIFCDLISHDYTMYVKVAGSSAAARLFVRSSGALVLVTDTHSQRTDTANRPSDGEPAKITVKRHQDYVALPTALAHSWKGQKIRPKTLPRMLALFEMLAVLRFQSEHGGALPDASSFAELQSTAERVVAEKGIATSVLQSDRLEYVARSQAELTAQGARPHRARRLCAVVRRARRDPRPGCALGARRDRDADRQLPRVRRRDQRRRHLRTEHHPAVA